MSESELEWVKFGRLRLRPGVDDCHPPTNNDFGLTVIHPSENIERQEEKDNGSVQIKLKRHFLMDFPLNKVSEIICGPSLSLCDFVNTFKD